ncbi:DNA mismatch repair protein Msh2 [Belonocnema kinseyi]|uniref:DNA mismatch repair protein Msh2 n=1 Tax=Belonocnema kinseyi TaxID=2817044 RepID=UPI00143D5B3A|nr:DNA mismatch repair protein Msh2 [Belonocnema kinseyi]
MAVQANQQFNLDQPTAQGFVRFFKNLPPKSSSTIRIFNRQDYYTLHGSDALFAAEEIFRTTSVCKMIGAEPNKIEGVVLNKNHFEAFLRDLLLVKQYRVEVYVNQASGKNQDWVIEYKGSPGNLLQFESILFDNKDIIAGSNIIAVKLGTEGKFKVVGLSCVDVVSTLISVCEFKDDDTFTNLESHFVTLAPKECLVVQPPGDNNPEFNTLKQLLERNNVVITLRKKSEFSSDTIVQDLNTLIRFKKGQQRNVQSFPEFNLNLAMSATAAIIKYLDLTSDQGFVNQFVLKEVEQSRYIRLDSAAIKALNIEPRTDSQNPNTSASILTLLDKCRTSQGHRLLAQWIRQPLRDLALIKERHDIVEILFKDNDLRTTLSDDYLRRVPDLQSLAKKLARKKGSLQDVYKIWLCGNNLPQMLEKLSNASNVAAMKAMIIDPLEELIRDLDKFQQMVEQTIDLEAAERGDFMVRPDFDDELKEHKSDMEDIEKKLHRQLQKAADDLSMDAGKSIKLESNQLNGYYFRITLKEEKVLRNNKTYTILDSNKGGVRFQNNKVRDLNEEYMCVREKYEAAQKSVVAEITSIAAGYSETVKSIGTVIANLDVFTSFAGVALNSQKAFVRPEILPSDAGILNLVQVRHPLLEIQEGVDFIANDVSLKRGESHFYIITGPNMGGKSTYIRSAGVAALLAHIGSFVPCDKASISLLDCILARIGADDSQIKGLSTFMAEMVETAAIIRTATCNSLVIIDELGRGTSTYEGCGIAWAIAEHLAKEVKCYSLFATHFHEITRLAEQVPAVENRHVTALVTDDRLTLLYKVMPGICDQSFGIHVAKMANFPEEVIEFAKRKQRELEDVQGKVFEGSDDPEKRRKIIKEGQELIADFAQKCKSLDKSLSFDELKSKITVFKEEILAHNNPYVNVLMSD